MENDVEIHSVIIEISHKGGSGMTFWYCENKIMFTPANAVCAYVRFEKAINHEKYILVKNLMHEFCDFFGKCEKEKQDNNKTFTYEVTSECFEFLKVLKNT